MSFISQKSIEIIIPFNNEAFTISKLLTSIEMEAEVLIRKCGRLAIVLIDDGSTDGSCEIAIRSISANISYRFLKNQQRQGKGYSIKRALESSSADLIFIQDADFEYPFENIHRFLDSMHHHGVNSVFGNRFNATGLRFFQFPLGFVTNKVFTCFVNLLFGCGRADIVCGQVLIRHDTIMSLELSSNGFEFETELAIKMKNRSQYVEVPVKYFRRKVREGKKLKLGDAMRVALFVCVKRIIFIG